MKSTIDTVLSAMLDEVDGRFADLGSCLVMMTSQTFCLLSHSTPTYPSAFGMAAHGDDSVLVLRTCSRCYCPDPYVVSYRVRKRVRLQCGPRCREIPFSKKRSRSRAPMVLPPRARSGQSASPSFLQSQAVPQTHEGEIMRTRHSQLDDQLESVLADCMPL